MIATFVHVHRVKDQLVQNAQIPSLDSESTRPGGLDAIFAPRSVAVIGATERAGSVGRTILWNLISSPFGGTVYPVNPTRSSILGIRAYPSIRALPEPVDLAVIVTPAATVPDVVDECIAAGTRGVIVISAGFKEVGPEGVALERRILQSARCWHPCDRPELPGRDAPELRAERDICGGHRPARECRLHQPERCVVHGGARLELFGKRRLQRIRLDRLDARCGLG